MTLSATIPTRNESRAKFKELSGRWVSNDRVRDIATNEGLFLSNWGMRMVFLKMVENHNEYDSINDIILDSINDYREEYNK